MRKKQKRPSIIALMLIISFGSVCSVLFLPSLPQIGDFFHVSDNAVSLTMSLFLIGSALGQLPYGPISDHFGRKKAMYGGSILAIISSLVCVLSGICESFTLLLIGRFFLALGSSSGVKTAYTMITDTHSGKHAAHLLAWTLLSFSIIPGMAVILGGLITQYLSWMANFAFLALYGVFILFLTTSQPETMGEAKKNALHPVKVSKRFWMALKSRELLICSGIIGSCTSMSALFGTESPFIAEEAIGLTPSAYGLFSFIPSLGGIMGCLLSTRLVHILNGKKIIDLGIAIMAFFSLVMLALFSIGYVNAFSLFGPMLLINIGMSVMQPSGTTIGVESLHNKSYASAILSFLNIGLSGLCVFFVNLLPENILVLPVSFTALVALMALFRPMLKADLKTHDH